MANSNETIDMELEALKAIYLDDINITPIDCCLNGYQYIYKIVIDIYPSTADRKSDQFVRLSLVIDLPQMYPNLSPVFQFQNIRGLNDHKIEKIKTTIKTVCDEKLGEIMLYYVIEKCRELLTSFNFPIGNICAICLYEFTTNDQIVKNECFHHLHSRCLADYFISIEKSLKQTKQIERNNGNNGNESLQTSSDVIVYCPVCRNNLDISHLINNMDPKKYALPYLSNEPLKDETIIIEEAKQNVKKFNEIYLKQLQNGGIIDAEAEKNKFFIRISEENNETTTS